MSCHNPSLLLGFITKWRCICRMAGLSADKLYWLCSDKGWGFRYWYFSWTCLFHSAKLNNRLVLKVTELTCSIICVWKTIKRRKFKEEERMMMTVVGLALKISPTAVISILSSSLSSLRPTVVWRESENCRKIGWFARHRVPLPERLFEVGRVSVGSAAQVRGSIWCGRTFCFDWVSEFTKKPPAAPLWRSPTSGARDIWNVASNGSEICLVIPCRLSSIQIYPIDQKETCSSPRCDLVYRHLGPVAILFQSGKVPISNSKSCDKVHHDSPDQQGRNHIAPQQQVLFTI